MHSLSIVNGVYYLFIIGLMLFIFGATIYFFVKRFGERREEKFEKRDY